jgi:hypothetical protein
LKIANYNFLILLNIPPSQFRKAIITFPINCQPSLRQYLNVLR